MEDEIKNDKFLTKKLQDLEQQIYLTIDVRTITNDKYPQKKWVPRGDKDKHMVNIYKSIKQFQGEGVFTKYINIFLFTYFFIDQTFWVEKIIYE